jgi:hypothetical protein
MLYGLLALVVSAVLLGGIIVASRPPPSSPLPMEWELVVLDLESRSESVLLSGLTELRFARFLADDTLVFEGSVDGVLGLWQLRPGGNPALLWEGGSNYASPSRDGTRGVFWRGGGLGILDVATRTLEVVSTEALSPAPWAVDPVFDEPGKRILFSWEEGVADVNSPKHIMTYNLTTGAVETLYTIASTGWDLRGLEFLPDGQHVVFALDGLFLFDVGISAMSRLTGPENAAFPHRDGTGRTVVYQTGLFGDESSKKYSIRLYRMNTGESIELLSLVQSFGPTPDINGAGTAIAYAREIPAP